MSNLHYLNTLATDFTHRRVFLYKTVAININMANLDCQYREVSLGAVSIFVEGQYIYEHRYSKQNCILSPAENEEIKTLQK